MKLLTTAFCFLAFAGITHIQAQVTTPALSPFCKIEQKVGLTDVTIEYSRPSARNRIVFGGVVPFGETWRAGANYATKLTFSTDVNFGDANLKAGSYALLITPSPDSWKFQFFNFDKPDWTTYVGADAATPAVVIMAKTEELPFTLETWTIGIGNLHTGGATLDFLWEKAYCGLDFSVPTDALTMESIQKTMGGPSAGDYSSAATYYLNEGKDLKQALEWINKGIEKGGERFWLLRTKALIQAGLGDKTGAIASIKRSTELAEEAGNDEYPRMNAASIQEWMQ